MNSATEEARVQRDKSMSEEGMSGQEYNYVQPVRHTRMGGRTIPIGVCDICGLVEPHATRSSKSGTHGERFYSHRHPLSFLVLESSNTGKRSYYIVGQPSERVRQHLEAAGRVWMQYKTYADIYEDIRFHLSEALGEAEEV
jgi:hypothetical protein